MHAVSGVEEVNCAIDFEYHDAKFELSLYIFMAMPL